MVRKSYKLTSEETTRINKIALKRAKLTTINKGDNFLTSRRRSQGDRNDVLFVLKNRKGQIDIVEFLKSMKGDTFVTL